MVVGGADRVWRDVDATKDLLALSGMSARWFVTNDMIGRFPGPCTAVTLHPQKLAGWIAERAKAGLPKPDQVWCHTKYAGVSNITDDWRGSVGLFGVAVARRLDFECIILCGVPMEAKSGHFVRGAAPWKACDQFMGGWKQRQTEIAPFVRSWSGWTGRAFGQPSLAFLEVKEEEAA